MEETGVQATSWIQVKTVAPSLGVLDKLPIGETVKGIIHPENKTEEKTEEKKEEKKK